MYIRNLQIKNLKLLRDVNIPFTRGDEIRHWTVLVGENGLCKTTILQAIALAASGPDRANQLAEVASLPDLRNLEEETEIQAEFAFGPIHHPNRTYPTIKSKSDDPPRLISRLWIPPDWKVFVGVSRYLNRQEHPALAEGELAFPEFFFDSGPLKQARAVGLPHWFVAGYGITRALPQPKSSERLVDPVRDRLDPLFDRGRIVGTGFTDLFEDTKLARSYVLQVQHALLGARGKPKVLPKIRSLELRGKGGVTTTKALLESHRFEFNTGTESFKVPATWLSQGYQAMIAWIADLVGQLFWETGKPSKIEKMEGLVLIDELDLHLHPLWQVGLIRALKATFPRIQFVATTHSPMLLPGLESDEIFHVRLGEDGNVRVEMADQSPELMTGSEIYQSFFGIDRLYPVDLGEDLRRYGYLSSDPGRSDQEEQELTKLRVKLREAGVEPGWEPAPRIPHQ
jgi:hypothetical protein